MLQTVMNVGFSAVALCCDNHPVNRSFLNSLTEDINAPCANPCDNTKLLHFTDPTHTIKNVFNNFQKRVKFFP